MDMQTGEMQFGSKPIGLYIRDEDCQRYFDALNTVLHGRMDSGSVEEVEQLMELLREAEQDEQVQVQRLKPFKECVADPARPTVVRRGTAPVG